MKNELKTLLLNYADFNNQEFDVITGLFKPKKVKKNQFLLNEGSICKEYFVILKGGIRFFFIDKKGNEKTRYVMLENDIGTTLGSYLSQKPSLEYIQAIEDTDLLAIDHASFYRLVEQMDRWNDFYVKILELAYTFQNRKIETLVTLTAKQRYDLVLEERPEFIQRLSNKILASYLDMREETLSRLKSI